MRIPTGLMDVMMVFLAFFMLLTALMAEQSLHAGDRATERSLPLVNLPEGQDGGPGLTQVGRQVAITLKRAAGGGDEYFLEGERINEEEIESRLRDNRPDEILLRVDGVTEFKKVVRLLSMAERLEVPVAIAEKHEPEGSTR